MIQILSRLFIEAISLQTARGRALLLGSLTLVIYLSRYEWLAGLSLWQRLGWESAPSIGLTRAYWLLLHGNLEGAWQRNWLIFPVIAVLCAIIIKDITQLLKTHNSPQLTD